MADDTTQLSDFAKGELERYVGSLGAPGGIESAPPMSPFAQQEIERYKKSLESEYGPGAQLTFTPGGHVASTPTSPYGLGEAVASGLTLGASKYLMAHNRAALTGVPYEQALRSVEADQAAYARREPLAAGLAETAGSIPTTVGAMALGQEYAVGPAMARIAAVAPRVAGALEFLGGGYEGGAFGRALSQASGGALQGAVSGALTSQLGDQSVGEAALTGAGIGAVVNPLTGLVMRPLAAHVAPEVASMAQRFMDLGIPLRGNQLPGAPLAAKAFPSGASEKQVSAFNRAISKTFGEDSSTLNHDLLFGESGAAKRIGSTMEKITADHAIPLDADLVHSLESIRANVAHDLASVPGDQARVMSHLDNIDRALASGEISGAQYQSLTKFGSGLYRDLGGKNSNLSHYAGEIKSALDDAWTRNLPPEKLKAWNDAKAQYKALMTVKPALDETSGGVSTGALYRSVLRKNRGSTAPAGDLGVLAEGGRNFLPSAESGAQSAHGLTPTKLGIMGAGGLAAEKAFEHFVPDVMSDVAHHPLAAAGLGTLVGAHALGGAFYASPLGARTLAATGGRGLRLPANPLVPAVEGLYRPKKRSTLDELESAQ